MPKQAKTLSDIHIRKLQPLESPSGTLKSRYVAVGGCPGLHIQVTPSGAKSWILKTTVGNKRREIGLGAYSVSASTRKKKSTGDEPAGVTLELARQKALRIKEQIRQGIDPVSQKKTERAKLKAKQSKEITFEEYARKTFIPIEAKNYASAPQVRRLNQLLRDYAYPHIGNMFIQDIERAHIVKLLEPIWEAKNETAKRVQNYIQKIIQRAIVEEIRVTSNPAIWKDNLSVSFPESSKVHTVQHHRAIHPKELPRFVKAIQELDKPKGSRPDVDAMLLMILTVGRPQEVRFGDWEEIDLKEKVWRQPAGKYKSKKRDWDIPLCTTAIKILKRQPSYAKQKGRIFSTLANKVIPDNSLSAMPDALGFDAVAHGFRATFRTWGQKQKRFTEEEIDLSMKHCETVSTRAAYAREQLLSERRVVLRAYEAWAMKGDSQQSEKVVSINKKRKAS
jgi:integrase